METTTGKNIGKSLKDTGIDNYFLNSSSIAQEIRAKVGRWDCIKLKSSCTSKETVIRIKRQPTEWKEISSSFNR
jgi:hypothetical protein